jgi:hypothetical protein
LFPGTFLVVNPSLPAISAAPNAIIEIQIQTDEFDFYFTRTFGSASGVTGFVYSMATPNLLLTEAPQVYFAALMRMYSKSNDSLTIPFSLKYFMLLSPRFGPKRVVSKCLTARPFVIQMLPMFRVPNVISSSLCTSASVLLVLFESTVYIWIGSDLGQEVWREIVGVEGSSVSRSFEVFDIDEGFASNLWVAIRSLRRLFAPLHLPVIVIPSESGRRVELVEVLDCDDKNGVNLVLQRYCELSRSILPRRL